jgi:hypothetical protein
MNNSDLWAALSDRMAKLSEVAEAADSLPVDAEVAWTGRTMKPPWFGEHMREEIVLHGGDVTGDDAAAQARLGESWMTEHSVVAVGAPLLAKGARKLGLAPGERVEGRLRGPGRDDVAVSASVDEASLSLVPAEGAATLETDAAARVLLLWGRRPSDPARVCSRVGRAALGRLRDLLSGY